MKSRKLLLLILLISSANLFSQICGTPYIESTMYSKSQSVNSSYMESSSTICINVYYHIVRETNGTGGFDESLLDDVTEKLNTAFNGHNLYVNKLGFDYINNSTYFNIDDTNGDTTEFDGLVQINNFSNAINIYIVNNASDYAGRANGILSQALVIEMGYANTQVVSHELGHCLNLLHTFQGTAANTTGCAEEIDGSNCTSCGDEVCDTPADANTGISGGYNPDLDNIMSYYYPFNNFSEGQATRIREAFASSSILQSVVSNSCTYIEGSDEMCTGSPETYTIENIPAGATINWGYPSNRMYIISGQGTSSCTFGAFTSDNYVSITCTVTDNGTPSVYSKNISILAGTSQQTPTIIIAPDNPFNLTCCGETYTFNHAVRENYSVNTEWEFNVSYQAPQDHYAFAQYGSYGSITVEKNTLSPLIVGAKARSIPTDCGNPSDWSNEISRYYGTVASSRGVMSMSLASVQENYNSEIPLNEYYSNVDNNLYLDTVDLYLWLDLIYSNRDLDSDEVERLIMLINNEASFKNLKIQVYNISGIKVFGKSFKSGSHVVNFSNFDNGVYFIEYDYGGITTSKTIVKG